MAYSSSSEADSRYPGQIRTPEACPPAKEEDDPDQGGPTLVAGNLCSTSDGPSQGDALALRRPHLGGGICTSNPAQSKPNLGCAQEGLRSNGASRLSMTARCPEGEGSSSQFIADRRPEHTAMDSIRSYQAQLEHEKLREALRITNLRQRIQARTAAYFLGTSELAKQDFHELQARDTIALSNAEGIYVGLSTALERALGTMGLGAGRATGPRATWSLL